MAASVWPAHTQAKTTQAIPEYLESNPALIIIPLLLLTTLLTYRWLKSRRELINNHDSDFHALADNAHDGLFIVQNEQLVYANQRAADILGYSNKEFLGLKLRDVVHPDEADHIIDMHQRRIRGEDVAKQYEAAFINKHNARVPVELTAAVTRWQGNSAGLVIIRDITDRKLIEQTLTDSEKRYRSLVENSPDAILIIDAESNSIIEANEQTEKLFKLSKPQLFETKLEKLNKVAANKQPKKPLTDYLQRALHGLPLIFEYEFHDSTGQVFICEVRLSRMPFPNRRLVRASISDITQRKQYQTALKKSETRLTGFFQASFESLFFHDDGIITDVNDIVEETFGYKKADVIGHHVLEFVAAETRQLAQHNMINGIEGPYELMALRKDGSLFPVEVRAKTLQQNKKNQRIVSVTDISVLQQINKKLLSSEQNLKNILNNMIDTFYRTDIKGNILMVSPSVEHLLGYKSNEITGYNLSCLYANPDDKQFFLDSLKASKGELLGYETALKQKNGDIIWVTTNACYQTDSYGNITGIECVTREISGHHHQEIKLNNTSYELKIKAKQHTTQQTLANNEHSFRILLENATDTFLLHDLQGRIVDINHHACKSLGYSREELLQLSITDIEKGPKPVDFSEVVTTLANKTRLQFGGIHKRKDGSHFPVEVNLTLIEKDKTNLILALVKDVSKQPSALSPPSEKPKTVDSP